MFFSLPLEYEPAGLFSAWHFLLLAVTLSAVAVALWCSRNMGEAAVRRTVQGITLVLWILEAAKILFVLLVTKSRNPNDFIPLYYCSLILYAGAASSLGRGMVRRIGDCFIATGGLVGGAVFLVTPTTSLPRYPAFHFISWHSFLLHGLMVYLALLLLMRGIYRPQVKELPLGALPIFGMCMVALAFNLLYDSISGLSVANLMFLSKDFPGTPVTLIYKLCGPFFTPFMCVIQSVGPYLLVLWGYLGVLALLKRLKGSADQ